MFFFCEISKIWTVHLQELLQDPGQVSSKGCRRLSVAPTACTLHNRFLYRYAWAQYRTLQDAETETYRDLPLAHLAKVLFGSHRKTERTT